MLIPHPGDPVPFGLVTFSALEDAQFAGDDPVTVEQLDFSNFGQMAVLVSQGESAEMANGLGISSILPAWSQGAKDFRVIAVDAIKPVYQIVTIPELPDIQELDGQTVGILGPTAAGTDALDVVLGAAGLTGQVQQTQVGTGNAGVAALEAGQIKGLAFAPPQATELEAQGYHVVGDMVDYVDSYITGMTVVNADWAEENRDAVVAYLKRLVEAGEWLANPANEDAVVSHWQTTVSSSGGGKISEETAKAMYDYYVRDGRLAFDGYAPQSALEGNLGVSTWRNILKGSDIPADLTDAFDWSYLNEALAASGKPEVPDYTTLAPTELDLD
ncbi:hypothetical protein GCM10025768_09850 [Microbacterium pseudoresistens]